MTDQQVDETIGKLLRYGVTLAASVVAIGGAWYLVRHGWETASIGVFHGEPRDLRTVGGMMESVRGYHSRGVIQLGVVLLIATPVARVAFSVAAFMAQRDRLYVGITLVVLAVLLLSLTGWLGG